MNAPDFPSAPTEVALFGGGCFWCLDVVFCQSEAQRVTRQAVIASLNAEKLWKGPIVTELVTEGVTEVAGGSTFYPAETYHQDYFEQNANQPYCMFVVAPKVAKFRTAFAERPKRTAA